MATSPPASSVITTRSGGCSSSTASNSKPVTLLTCPRLWKTATRRSSAGCTRTCSPHRRIICAHSRGRPQAGPLVAAEVGGHAGAAGMVAAPPAAVDMVTAYAVDGDDPPGEAVVPVARHHRARMALSTSSSLTCLGHGTTVRGSARWIQGFGRFAARSSAASTRGQLRRNRGLTRFDCHQRCRTVFCPS